MNDKIIQPSEWSFTYKNQASNTTWVTVNSDNVYTKAAYNGSNANGCINAQYYIDLTNYTKITVVSTYFKRAWGRYIPIFVKDTNNVVEISGTWVKKSEPWDTSGTQQTGTTQTFTLDVSDLNGYYYVGWGIQGSGDYAECTVYSFVLEGVNPYKNGGIWDFDGTTDYQIGKLYDWDGTANNQIGKVYDWDGTSNNLIYSSTPEYLYNLGDQMTSDTGGWVQESYYLWYGGGSGTTASFNNRNNYTVRFDDTRVWIQSRDSNYNGQSMRTVNAVDFTDINSITLNYTKGHGRGSYSYTKIRITPNIVTSGATQTCIYNSSPVMKNLTDGQTYTITLDTSAYTGEYYIYVCVTSGDSRGNGIYVNSISVSAN